MFLHIDPAGGLAVYDQIVRQVKYAVANGALPEGELVPSVRELARELAINPNTVARAYGRLQDAQLLEPIRGRGLAVVRGARKKCQTDRTRLIGARLLETLAEASQSGLERSRIETLVQKSLDDLDQQSNHHEKQNS
jgi:DNA-binding transcriptional regulator YhcF (GntR family)